MACTAYKVGLPERRSKDISEKRTTPLKKTEEKREGGSEKGGSNVKCPKTTSVPEKVRAPKEEGKGGKERRQKVEIAPQHLAGGRWRQNTTLQRAKETKNWVATGPQKNEEEGPGQKKQRKEGGVKAREA